jgi:peptidoglycan hydrolase CwlO-like protein
MAAKDHLAKHDREIAAIRKLLFTGMKMLNGVIESQREMQDSQRGIKAELRELAASQRETDRQLQVLVRSLQRGGNGHSKRPIQ